MLLVLLRQSFSDLQAKIMCLLAEGLLSPLWDTAAASPTTMNQKIYRQAHFQCGNYFNLLCNILSAFHYVKYEGLLLCRFQFGIKARQIPDHYQESNTPDSV